MFDLNDIEERRKFSLRLSELRTNTLFTKEKREEIIYKISEYRLQRGINCKDLSKIEDVIKEIKYDKSLLHIEEWVTDKVEKPLTQYALGKIIGRGRTTITAWESGKNIPEYTELYMLCNIFDIHVGYLLGDIQCHKYSEQNIVDITGLSEEASNVLLDIGLDTSFFNNMFGRKIDSETLEEVQRWHNEYIDIISNFLTNENFEEFLEQIKEYFFSFYSEKTARYIYKKHPERQVNLILERDGLYSAHYKTSKMFDKLLDSVAEKYMNIDYKQIEEAYKNGLI